MIPILLAASFDKGWLAFLILNPVVLLVSLLDLWIIPRRKQLSCKREIDEEIERENPFDVHLELTNRGGAAIRFRVIDGLPASFERPFPIAGEVSGGDTVRLTYRFKARVRGDYTIERLYLRYRSILGLWEKQMVFACPDTVRVIPDMSRVREFMASAQQYLLYEGEKLRKKRIGTGEFAGVRKYVSGDDPRKINWHQTAKLAEIMTNVYEPEHGKHVTLMIDCGRSMGVELTRGNRLEYSLEAALLVAAAALRQGDYVSVLAFSNQVKAFIPPGKTMSHLQTIIRGVYNLQHDPVEPNYAGAFDYLEKVQKRRSFMLLFSHLDPFLFEETPLFFLERIRRRHVFLLLGIADSMVQQWARTEPEDTRTAMIKSTAQRYLMKRRRKMVKWDRLGLQMLEAPEDRLAPEALSRYIEVMNRGVL
ncbi:MAG: DUF58 domain-containing protein [Bacillaceae bacterium]|nr:DUF58 domain-containing protein [Bacillaceae bacterium]